MVEENVRLLFLNLLPGDFSNIVVGAPKPDIFFGLDKTYIMPIMNGLSQMHDYSIESVLCVVGFGLSLFVHWY